MNKNKNIIEKDNKTPDSGLILCRTGVHYIQHCTILILQILILHNKFKFFTNIPK